MTALAPLAPLAPTRFEHFLLRLSRVLADSADQRMRRRAAARSLRAHHLGVADAQRDLAASVRSGMLPR